MRSWGDVTNFVYFVARRLVLVMLHVLTYVKGSRVVGCSACVLPSLLEIVVNHHFSQERTMWGVP